MSDLLNTVIMCVDASLRIAPEVAEDGGNGLANRVNDLIEDFKSKYEITNPDMGNDASWETASDKQMADARELDHKILLLLWDHIKEVVLDTATGDIVREVIASEILHVAPSWDKTK